MLKNNNKMLSYGILLYSVNTDKFLMYQRRDSYVYTDILNGRDLSYLNNNKTHIITDDEVYKLLTNSFDQLWDDLWVNHNARTYKYGREKARRGFNSFNLDWVISKLTVDTNPYEIPKGRKKSGESSIDCAMREFREETGVVVKFKRVSEIPQYLEPTKVYILNYPVPHAQIGCDGEVYNSMYYKAVCSNELFIPEITHKMCETKHVEWVTVHDASDDSREVVDLIF